MSNRLQRWFVLLAGIGCLTGCGGLQAVFDPVDFAGDKQAEAVPEGGEYTSASVGRIGSGLFEDEYEGEALVVEGYYSQPMGQYTNAFERANDRVAGMIYEEDPAAQLRAQLPKQNPDGTFQMADPQQMGAAKPQKTLMLSLTEEQAKELFDVPREQRMRFYGRLRVNRTQLGWMGDSVKEVALFVHRFEPAN